MPLDPAKIKARRQTLGLTQEQAAAAAGMPRPHWSRLETATQRAQRGRAMLPHDDGYYWVKLTDASPWQVVRILRWATGERIVYFTRATGQEADGIAKEYPGAVWSARLTPPMG